VVRKMRHFFAATLVPRLASAFVQSSVQNPTCPRCGGAVERIRRRFIDRVLSLFRPVRRYRCENFLCHWEGTCPVNPSPRRRGRTGS
jgi:hypothetical protein